MAESWCGVSLSQGRRHNPISMGRAFGGDKVLFMQHVPAVWDRGE